MRRAVDVRSREQTSTKPDFGFDFVLDIGQIARGMGAQASRVSDPDELADAVRAAMADDRPHVVEVQISPAIEFVKSHGPPMAV